jgi:putative transposase
MSSKHSEYALGYHIIWCTKYRKGVLVNAVEVECKHILSQVCAEYGWLLPSLEIMPDHVHCFVKADPSTCPMEIAKTLKSISAVYLFTKFSSLKKRSFWGSGLWSRSTYYGSVGSISEETVRRYIELQKEKD